MRETELKGGELLVCSIGEELLTAELPGGEAARLMLVLPSGCTFIWNAEAEVGGSYGGGGGKSSSGPLCTRRTGTTGMPIERPTSSVPTENAGGTAHTRVPRHFHSRNIITEILIPNKQSGIELIFGIYSIYSEYITLIY